MPRGAPPPTSKITGPKPTSKKDKNFKFEAQQRNLLAEGRDAIQLMREAYPALYDTQQAYNSKFAELEAQTGADRARAETAAVTASGTTVRDALRGASPEIAATGDALLAGIKGTGPSGIETELTNQALSELRMGGELSADELRQVVQGSRAASSARGLGMGNAAAISEVMNRAGMAEARKGARRSFAAGVDANSQQRRASDNSYVLNAGQAAMRDYDPYQRLYGKGGSQATGTVSGPSQFGNYLSASSNVGAGNQDARMTAQKLQEERYQFGVNREDSNYWSRVNMDATNANAAAQRRSANSNAMMSTVGSLGGAAIGAAGTYGAATALGAGAAGAGAAAGGTSLLSMLAFL